MDTKWVVVIALLSAIVGSLVVPRGNAQATAGGPWQMISSSSNESGGVAWKYNVETGQSFFCYRQNCFAHILVQQPK